MLGADLNLLVALDALLAEGSVTGAARRLGLSTSAMSRTLVRLRLATRNPLLVRAGRGLVPTPRAAELRDRVHLLTRDAQAVLRPTAIDPPDIAALELTFTIRANEGFIAVFAAPLLVAITQAAPGVRVRFAPKPDKDARPLREGQVDLEIGVLGDSVPEARTQMLFRDRFVGVARAGHPLLAGQEITPRQYAACGHVVASRRGASTGPVDDALDALGLKRAVVAVVPGFPDAVRIARCSDLIALVTQTFLNSLTEAGAGAAETVKGFALPVPTPEIAVSATWHPRMDADPVHRWLRNTVIEVCKNESRQRAKGGALQ
ncbi:LysR family transcriptional regulator [Mesorhizobium sp.]|uniref:LysR family transcriptional regulator n=1 Tax=Mesorhizobium sp. TaxID=1871066 RepID=UPI003BABA1D9